MYLVGSSLILLTWYPLGKLIDKYMGSNLIMIAILLRGVPLMASYWLHSSNIWVITSLLIVVMIGNYNINLVNDTFFQKHLS
jgi:hypothetical protein